MNSGSNNYPDDRAVLAHILGELNEEQSTEVFAAIAAWRQDSESAGEDLVQDSRHIPASVLACWDSIQSELPALEKQLVAAHLQHCGQCQEDRALVRDHVEAPRRKTPILPWISGAVVGAALAATLILAILPQRSTQPDGPALHSANWIAPTFTRGDAPEIAAPGLGESLLLVIAVGAPRTDDVKIEILDPDGARVLDRSFAADEIRAGSLLLQWQLGASEAWAAGRYVCRVQNGEQSSDGVFVLVRP